MTRCNWFIFHITIAFILTGCIGNKSQPVIQPIQTLVITPTIPLSPTNTSSLPAWCKKFNPVSNLPEISKFGNSHILYKAFPLKNEGNGADQVWKFSIKNGANILLSNVIFPQPETKYDQYDSNGNGFSLNSADEKHIAIWGHGFESSNTDGTYSLIIRDKESSQDIDIFRTNPLDEIQGGWSPEGNHFVFISYKDTNPYYSLVYVVNADGTGLSQLTEQMSLELLERPRWSPDSSKIAIPIWDKHMSGMDMMIINFQKGNVNRYKVSPSIRLFSTHYGSWVEQGEMAWSPDSRWFAYISEYEHNGIEILNTENGEIYCVENEKISGVDKIIWLYDNE